LRTVFDNQTEYPSPSAASKTRAIDIGCIVEARSMPVRHFRRAGN
jgi:hypothetical protein